MGAITTYPPQAPVIPVVGTTLGYAEITSGAFSIAAGTLKITGLTVTVTVPAGRRLKVSTYLCMSGGTTTESQIYMDGARLNRYYDAASGNFIVTHAWSVVVSPSAGTHTFDIYTVNQAAGTMYADSNECYILVEDITSMPQPYPQASVPVGMLGQAVVTGLAAGAATQYILGTETALPNYSVNVTVPDGRILRIMASGDIFGNGAVGSGIAGFFRLKRDGVEIDNYQTNNNLNNQVSEGWQMLATDSPPAGAHVYTVTLVRNVGTLDVVARVGGSDPGRLIVEDITPTPTPANTASSSTLGYAEVTANQLTITTEVDLTGLSTTVTVPAGRRLRITGHVKLESSVAGDQINVYVKEGATVLGTAQITADTGNRGYTIVVEPVISPTAGAHTYKLTAARSVGTGNVALSAATGAAAYILVEDITPVSITPTAIVPGAILCTSSARPASPSVGTTIFETDTLRGRQWDGTAWRLVGPRFPVARLRKTDVQAISGSWVAITFNTVDEDTWNQYSGSATSRLTCQEAGVYNIEGTVGWANTAGGSRGVGLRKNGTGAVGPGLGTNLAAPNTSWSFKNNVIANGVRLAVGDWVELVAVTTVNANTVTEDGDSHLAWTYVGA